MSGFVEAPDVEQWFHSGVPEWVRRSSLGYARPDSELLRVTAVALLLRFQRVEPGDRTLPGLIERADRISTPLIEWGQCLPLDAVRRVLSASLDEADALVESLEEFPDRLGEQDAETNSRMAVSWLERRDNLEAVVDFLRAAGHDCAVLVETLKRIDLLGRSHATLRSIDLGASERLQAVAWQDPEAWWGMPW